MEEKKTDISKIKSYAIKFVLFIALFFIIDYAISAFLTTGLKKYYGLDKPAELALVGHSHTMLGLDKQAMEEALNIRIGKYAIEGANVMDRFTMIKHFVNSNGESLKAVTYDVDAWFITVEGLSLNSYVLFYPFLDDKDINEHVKKGAIESGDKVALTGYYVKKFIRTARFIDLNLNGSMRGWLGFYSNLKMGSLDVEAYKQRIAADDFQHTGFDEGYRKVFEEMLDYTAEHNIKLILLGIPTVGPLNRAEPEKYSQAMAMLQSYADRYDNVYFFDYNPEFEDQYDIFYDPVHLNPKGNELITKKVVEDLKQLNIF